MPVKLIIIALGSRKKNHQKHPNIIKFKNLMTSKRKPILKELCKLVCSPG